MSVRTCCLRVFRCCVRQLTTCRPVITCVQKVRLRGFSLRAKLIFVLLLTILLLLYLHYRILPSAMGYYNEDCFMQEDRRERMRFVLRHVIQFFNDENATYWLDFGTLLGVVREGDIMAHDGDLDVSRLADNLTTDKTLMSRFTQRMKTVGIDGSPMSAKFKDVSVDLFRWQTVQGPNSTTADHSHDDTTLLKQYYPFVPRVLLLERISNYFFPVEIPRRVLFPLRRVEVAGVLAKVPRRSLNLLKRRYPLTWYMDFPYKWKCWTRS